MAGSGYKLFVNGTTLSASDLNNYVQQQTVMVFASASARTTALASVLSEGMISYRTDAHVLEVYNGTAWVAPETNLTTKGDLATYDTAPSRLGVGSDGSTLIANSSASTGLSWANQFQAGKNKILNSDLSIWQRGTSFTPSASSATYVADRFFVNRDGSGATVTVSQQAFTPGSSPVAGYEGAYFYRYNQSVAGSGATYGILASQRVEDVRTLAGQTVTWSFWAKADSNRNITLEVYQNYGSGGSSSSGNLVSSPTLAITTSWTRYSVQISLTSLSGKTLGTGSFLSLSFLDSSLNATKTVDTWGWQLEAGSVATAFSTATGTLQGELAACQRYYYRVQSSSAYNGWGVGYGINSTGVSILAPLPVTMRAIPTVLDYSQLAAYDGAAVANASAAVINAGQSGNNAVTVTLTSTSITQYRPTFGIFYNNSAGYIGFGAEL